jgi:predicted amidophosphoribosyltransferase
MALMRKTDPREAQPTDTCAKCGAAFMVPTNARAHQCQREPDRVLPAAVWGERQEPLRGWW